MKLHNEHRVRCVAALCVQTTNVKHREKNEMNRVLKFIWKSLLIVIIILTPALVLLLSDFYTCFFRGTIGNFIVMYLPAIIFAALVVWKKPCGWFVLPAGFLIAPLMDPLWMFLLGRKYSFLFATSTDAMIINLFGYYVIYALPFAVLSSLPAIPSIKAWYRRKKR